MNRKARQKEEWLSPRKLRGDALFQARLSLNLLPSGLYRRPRSFTGSWGLQAIALQPSPQMRSKRVTQTLKRYRPPLAGFTADRESGIPALRRFPHPAPKVKTMSDVKSVAFGHC